MVLLNLLEVWLALGADTQQNTPCFVALRVVLHVCENSASHCLKLVLLVRPLQILETHFLRLFLALAVTFTVGAYDIKLLETQKEALVFVILNLGVHLLHLGALDQIDYVKVFHQLFSAFSVDLLLF